MGNKTAKINSDVKYARLERKLMNHQKYHKFAVKRFHRSDRQTTKATLKAYNG